MPPHLPCRRQRVPRFVQMLFLFLCVYGSVNGQDEFLVEAPEGVQVQRPKDPILFYLKRHLNVRRGLIKRTCELSEADIKNLDSFGEDWIKKELDKEAPKQDGVLNQGLALVFGGAPQPNGANESNKIMKIQSQLDKKLTEVLSPEQRGQFLEAIENSEKYECEANAQVLVSQMDKMFVLTEEQRESLEPKIATWLKGKSLYMQYYTQQKYLPNMPASIVEKVLTSEQLKRFNGMQKVERDRLSIDLQMFQHQPQLAEQDY